MLGWDVRISRIGVTISRNADGVNMAHVDPEPGEELASWATGLGGTKWIDRLLESGKAVSLRSPPNSIRCIAVSGNLLPLIFPDGTVFPDGFITASTYPDTFAREFGRGSLVVNRKAIASCTGSEWLLIQIWDAS